MVTKEPLIVVAAPQGGSVRRTTVLTHGLGVGQSASFGVELRMLLKCPQGMQEKRFCFGETDVLTRIKGSDDREYRAYEVRTVMNLLVGVLRLYQDHRGLVFVP